MHTYIHLHTNIHSCFYAHVYILFAFDDNARVLRESEVRRAHGYRMSYFILFVVTVVIRIDMQRIRIDMQRLHNCEECRIGSCQNRKSTAVLIWKRKDQRALHWIERALQWTTTHFKVHCSWVIEDRLVNASVLISYVHALYLDSVASEPLNRVCYHMQIYQSCSADNSLRNHFFGLVISRWLHSHAHAMQSKDTNAPVPSSARSDEEECQVVCYRRIGTCGDWSRTYACSLNLKRRQGPRNKCSGSEAKIA